MPPAEPASEVLISQVNTCFPLLQLLRMELCLQAAPEAVEPFMPSLKRMEHCFGRCRWRTATTAHRRLLKEKFSSLTPARRHTVLTPQRVNNCGIIQAVAQTAAKEAAARRRSYTLRKCMSAMTIVTRQMVLCWMPTPEPCSEDLT